MGKKKSSRVISTADVEMAQNCKIVLPRKHREDIDPYQTFSANIERAEYFIELYKQKIKVRACKGRPPISDTDMLRAGVVFFTLHSGRIFENNY